MRSTWTGGGALALECDSDQLATAVHRREPGAFEMLVERFETSLFNYANRLLGNASDAEGVVLDVFLRAHDALTTKYDVDRIKDLALKPWLFRIARSLSFAKRRGRSSGLDEPLESYDDGRLGPLLPSGSMSVAVERNPERRELERAIAFLPMEARELIVLRFMEEMSYGEMAKSTGLSEAVLRGKVFRSLKLLRDALSRNEVTDAM